MYCDFLIIKSYNIGTRSERGMLTWRIDDDKTTSNGEKSAYDLPFIMPWLRRQKCCYVLPIMPAYKTPKCSSCARSPRDHKSTMTEGFDNNAVTVDEEVNVTSTAL